MDILDAAERVFSEKGFDGSRTRDIASLAGVNVSTLHYHYKSKEELYAAVLQRVLGGVRDKIVAEASALAPGGSSLGDRPGSHARAFVAAHFDAIAARPHFPKLMVDALIHAPAAVRSVAHEIIAPIIATLVPLLVDGMQRGALRQVDVRQIVLSIVGMNVIYFLAAPVVLELFGEAAYGDDAVAARKAAVIDLLLHGILPGKEGEQ